MFSASDFKLPQGKEIEVSPERNAKLNATFKETVNNKL